MRPIERLMKPSEVAELFGVSPKTVVKWARNGRVAAVPAPGGRGYLFHPDDVAALMKAEQATQNDDGPARCSSTERAL